jgi:5-methylcytosine-specific restriction endonuclease McrA
MGMSLTKTCRFCGTEFSRKEGQPQSAWTRTIFCTPRCSQQDNYQRNREQRLETRRQWREKNPAYFKQDHLRDAALRRAREARYGGLYYAALEQGEYRCTDCGRDGQAGRTKHDLAVHHRDGNVMNNVLENFELLCNSCHARRHYRQGDLAIGKKAA